MRPLPLSEQDRYCADARALRLLFIPVSAPRGIGEYARTKEIATAVAQRWPNAVIHFVLNRSAPYAASVPFPTTWLPSSATFHPKRVAALIHDFRPNLVIFDNAGRTSQLKAARDVGSRVIFISSRPRQRRKAFRLRWMNLIDEHWIAYPEFVAGSLTRFERLKLAMMQRPVVRYVDTIMPQIEPLASAAVMAKFGLQPENYVLIVPGGGTGHPGAEDAPQVMADTAAKLAARGYHTLLVAADVPRMTRSSLYLKSVPRLAMSELTALVRTARLVVTNGGDTLVQALACARACVATAIAHDQHARIERCQQAGLVLSSALDASELERSVLLLLNDEPRRLKQVALVSRSRITNGMDQALDAISTLAPA